MTKNIHKFMHKNTKSKHLDATWLFIWSAIALIFGAFLTIIIIAYYRNIFAKKYILEVGDALPGSSKVYLETSDNIVLLNDINHRALAKALTSGDIYFKRNKDVLTGERLEITAISSTDDSVRNYIYIEQLDTGKARVTVVNQNGTTVATLTNTRYSSFIHLSGVHTGNGDNTKVDCIP